MAAKNVFQTFMEVKNREEVISDFFVVKIAKAMVKLLVLDLKTQKLRL